ncbi:MAG: C4-dicarboxylate ABC transporter substrate-binding protein, partial [Deltaproteobacteria bacterium]|nr:C4-dicarboxylate ABC transporter substrate-binding protein [Deltaproteobacteria bacterium]
TVANLPVVTFAVVMNKDKWNSLPADVKKVLDGMRREQAQWTGEYVDNHVKEALAWSKKNYNHQLFTLSAPEAETVKSLLKPILDDYTKRVTAQGFPGGQILADALAIKKKHEQQGR